MHGILSQREVNLDGDEKGEAAAVSAMPSITKIKAITPGTPRAAVRLFFLPSVWRVATLFEATRLDRVLARSGHHAQHMHRTAPNSITGGTIAPYPIRS